MLSHLRLRPRGGRLGRASHASRPFARYLSQNQGHQNDEQHAPVRILRPTAWSIAAIATIYFTCAAYDVRQDAKKYSKDSRRTLTLEQIENDEAPRQYRESFRGYSNSGTFPVAIDSPRATWNSLSGPGQVMATVFGINAAALTLKYMPSSYPQQLYWGLAHTPVEGAFRYRQLITSAFAHTGPLHFGVNMLVMFNFASSLAHTPVFNGSGSHTLAFYLSSGIVSALGSHISTRFRPNQFARFVPAMGFSGVASAVFAGWCMENPDSRVRIMFLPFSFTARGMLEGLTVFETLGVLGALRMFSFGVAHAAHLSGLLFGASYVAYGGGEKLWIPFRRAAFRSLRSVGLV